MGMGNSMETGGGKVERNTEELEGSNGSVKRGLEGMLEEMGERKWSEEVGVWVLELAVRGLRRMGGRSWWSSRIWRRSNPPGLDSLGLGWGVTVVLEPVWTPGVPSHLDRIRELTDLMRYRVRKRKGRRKQNK
jgi:hypothetical protein